MHAKPRRLVAVGTIAVSSSSRHPNRQPCGIHRVHIDWRPRFAVTYERHSGHPRHLRAALRSEAVELQHMKAVIDAAKGSWRHRRCSSFEVIVRGCRIGLGNHVQWDRKLDGRLAQTLMSIQAIKGVGIGRGADVCGFEDSRRISARGTTTHPEMPVRRPTNNAEADSKPATSGETFERRS